MLVKTHYQVSSSDLEVVLAVVRSGTQAEAGQRLGIDGSTVFRAIRKLEKSLGQPLFERSRGGSRPTALALELAQRAERIELELEDARAVVHQRRDGQLTGVVKLTTTDTLLHGLILPVFKPLSDAHPRLQIQLDASNETASLIKRDSDIAVRATREPPDNLVGKHIGPIKVALFGPRGDGMAKHGMSHLERYAWIAPDEALPKHPSVAWRKRHYPSIVPRYMVNSILSVAEGIARGLGVGLLPLFLTCDRSDLVQLSDPIQECETQLWLLRHPESGHIARIATVYSYLAEHLTLS
ncbi:LysR family transcriptional regulator [Burkholderia sp. Bp9012]|nr:LysR family transcriptional regulator [Burkholderia sp. Bp9012]